MASSSIHNRGSRFGIRRSARRTALAGIVAGVFAGLAAPVFAQDRMDHGGRHHGWQQMDPDARADRMEYMVMRMFSSVKATDDQKAKAGTIVRKAIADLRPIMEKRREGHKAALELLSKPKIDRGAIEAQRAQQSQLADAMSKRMTQAFVDLAEVLTPEQRTQLAQRMASRHTRGDHPRGGNRSGGGGDDDDQTRMNG
jgi:Spy/CpxP family protein refolding chaperone